MAGELGEDVRGTGSGVDKMQHRLSVRVRATAHDFLSQPFNFAEDFAAEKMVVLRVAQPFQHEILFASYGGYFTDRKCVL